MKSSNFISNEHQATRVKFRVKLGTQLGDNTESTGEKHLKSLSKTSTRSECKTEGGD